MIPDWKLEKYLTGDLPAEEMREIREMEATDEIFANRVKMLREAGAKEVHVRIASPMMRFTCHYGVDTSTPDQLLCAHRTLEEACAVIGADSLGYLSPESTRDSCFGCANPCQACFTGEYPTLLYDDVTSED